MDLDPEIVERLKACGVRVNPVCVMGRWRHVVETSTRDQARIVLNLLERDKCFLEDLEPVPVRAPPVPVREEVPHRDDVPLGPDSASEALRVLPRAP
jgi:hypothetical protein